MNAANNLRKDLLDKWVKLEIVKDITSNTSMEMLHKTYCKYCEVKGCIPYRRKFFAYLLKQCFIEAIEASEILIYHNKEVLVKGIKINNK